MLINLIKTTILLLILILNNKFNLAEFSSSNYLNLKPNFDYEKYSIGLNKNKIPTLENLFQRVTYWDMNNASSPCKHDGKKRSSMCQKVVTFDQVGYELSLKDTKELLLSRLNLKQEPEIKMNRNTLNFIDELENNILDDNTNNKRHSTIKTKYDMKTSQNKVLNTMHEALSVSNCENSDDGLDESENLLCLNFEVPLKNFYKVKDGNSVYIRKLSSVVLWLFLRTQFDESNENIELRIQSLNSKTAITLDRNQLVDGWNTINLTHIFHLPSVNTMTDYSNKTQALTISLDCVPLCTIGYSMDDLIENNEHNFKTILLSNSPSRKPLLSIKIFEDKGGDMFQFDKNNIRNKRKTYHHNPNINYKAYGIDRDNYNPRLCYNNYPDSNRECCLITYFVNFNSLKWSSWILHPPGFVANYCSGKCNDLKSFKYAGHNAEVKLKYNERLLSKETFDAGEMLETCCHPISMDSLVIKYLATNGSVVSTVIPNMIITGCGCS